jgi:hypothetical protein
VGFVDTRLSVEWDLAVEWDDLLGGWRDLVVEWDDLVGGVRPGPVATASAARRGLTRGRIAQ